MLTNLVATALVALSLTFSMGATTAPTPAVDVILDSADMFTSEQEQVLTERFTATYEDYDIVPVLETITSLEGKNIEQYALERANKLGVGDEQKDNGLYILLSKSDQEFQFELGSGVGEVVDSGTVQAIVDDLVIPEFKRGDFVEGVVVGVDAIAENYLNGGSVPIDGDNDGSTSPSTDGFIAGFFVFFIILAIVILIIVFLKRKTPDLNNSSSAKEAREFWDSLPASKQKSVQNARSKKEKTRLLNEYGGNSSYDMNTLLPLLLILGTTQNTSAAYGASSYNNNNSGYTSSSSSSSYSDYSSSSFDGGSFGGDSGGGSW